jgi:hypothetical protein
VEGALSAALHVSEHWSLRARASLTVAPWAHTSPYVSSPLSSDALVLGEPLWLARVGLGAEWGTP